MAFTPTNIMHEVSGEFKEKEYGHYFEYKQLPTDEQWGKKIGATHLVYVGGHNIGWPWRSTKPRRSNAGPENLNGAGPAVKIQRRMAMKKIREFEPADRYRYDFGLCSIKNGFAQIDSDQDAWYFGTWANPEKLIIFNYYEGDCCTTLCETNDEFRQELEELNTWYTDQGRPPIQIDCGLGAAAEKMKRRFSEAGLGFLVP
jgi:hypothetical protein